MIRSSTNHTKGKIAAASKEGEKDQKGAIIGELAKLTSIYQAAGDKVKVMDYRRAIWNIMVHPKPITNVE